MFYILQLILFTLITVALSVMTLLVGSFEPYGKKAYRINQLWSWTMLRLAGVSLSVKGLQHIDPKRPYIFIVNHQSNIDIPVLVQALPQFQLRWLAKKELLRVPFFGRAMWATKHVTVDRSDPHDAVKSLERAKERLAAGISLVVYPEGTRSKDGNLQRFKKGGFLLAVQTNTLVVPVTVSGSAALLPVGAWRVRPGLIEVTVEQPIGVEGFRPGNLRLLSNQVRDKIASHLRDHDHTQSDRPAEINATIVGHRAMENSSI